MTMMFVSLPVTDLERSKAFYAALGFAINPAFSDHNVACYFVEEDHSALMIMTRDFMQTMTELPLGDPKTSPSSSVSVFVESREAVDKAISDGLAAGGSEPHEPADYGFMYQRGVDDPDGNSFEFGWMNPDVAAGGPEAAAAAAHA
jgi:predicted lactoylglutathione lyase